MKKIGILLTLILLFAIWALFMGQDGDFEDLIDRASYRICELVTGRNGGQDLRHCLKTVAVYIDSPDLCFEIRVAPDALENPVRAECLTDIAVSRKDASLCQYLDPRKPTMGRIMLAKDREDCAEAVAAEQSGAAR